MASPLVKNVMVFKNTHCKIENCTKYKLKC